MKNQILLIKTVIIFISLFVFNRGIHGQAFNGTSGSILNNGTNSYFNLTVSGLNPSIMDSAFGLDSVWVNINHPAVQELYVYLVSPGGEQVELTEGQSCTGANYTNTCFVNTAPASITLGTAPYTGCYRPVGYLGRFNTGQTINGTWQLVILNSYPGGDLGYVISWRISFGNVPAPPVKFKSSNLPIVIINTNSQVIGDSTIYANLGIIDNGTGIRNNLTDTWNNYNGRTKIHIRGNSTRYLEKQSFSLKTVDALDSNLNVSIMGMPSDDDWDLVAPYQDKSLIRNPIGYDLFREMGNYSSRVRNVELVINGEYRGIYVFQEKLKQGKNRIDVNKMTTTDNAMPQISGGYIFKVDRPGPAGSGWYSLMPGDSTPNNHFFFAYDYPQSTDITSFQQSYLQSSMNNFETIMASDSFASLASGYCKYIDIGSFIDYLIIEELSKNADAYRISTYMYKDNITKGGLIHMGPPWDFGIGWHNCNYGNSFSPAGWQYQLNDTTYPEPSWWARFMLDSNFVNKLSCRWKELRLGILSSNSLNNYIDSSVTALTESEPRNFTQWPVMGAYIWPNPQNEVGATWPSEVNDLKTWITNRLSWMDGAITGRCVALGVKELNPVSALTIYPNPFSSTVNVNYEIIAGANVKLELFNALGAKVSSLFEGIRGPGTYTEEIPSGQVSDGIYSLRLTVNDVVSYKKIIKIGY